MVSISPPGLVVLELALHQKLRSNGIRDKVYQHVYLIFKLSVAIRLTLECLDTPFDKIDKTA